jgi:hypothetical protein
MLGSAEFDGPDSPVSPAESIAAAKPGLTLLVDYIPGRSKQSWTLQRGGALTSGEGEPELIAANICAIMFGSGSQLVK